MSQTPIVIDLGSSMIKANYSGVEEPMRLLNAIGYPKYDAILGETNVFMADSLDASKGICKIDYPMHRGTLLDDKAEELLFEHLFKSCFSLHSSSVDSPMLLTENAGTPKSTRLALAELLFETFNVPALSMALPSVLSLYASGATTGTVLDVGDGCSTAISIFDGYLIPSTLQRTDVGGRDVTFSIQRMLRRLGCVMTSSSELELIRLMKESPSTFMFSFSKDSMSSQRVDYTLPDGTVLPLNEERWLAPELLFSPDLIGVEGVGVVSLLTNSILSADRDIRSSLYNAIWLSGGSTLFNGFASRLSFDLAKSTKKTIKMRISAPPERRYTAFLGGSILASLDSFRSMWLSKVDYEESGSDSLSRYRSLSSMVC
mmetsp:Transcript_11698/g.17361  ORF Transcript_11698/g.17361 Transcript_11698/m.17361 type:complete len:373 (+) Transcript_11698:40-1158(+)